jgi:hypothetical protein
LCLAPHPPEGAPPVGAARFGREEVMKDRKVTSDVHNSNMVERFYSVVGCFRIFWRGTRPWV